MWRLDAESQYHTQAHRVQKQSANVNIQRPRPRARHADRHARGLPRARALGQRTRRPGGEIRTSAQHVYNAIMEAFDAAMDKVELRGLCHTHLAQALDAMAHTEGVDRNTYVNQVLDEHVREKAHKTILLHQMLKGNPYLTEDGGGRAE